MSQLRLITGATLTTLWVVLLGFLALSQPSHALFESSLAALFAQAVGGLALGSVFAFRGAIHQQYERFGRFLVRSRGLRSGGVADPRRA